jgi:hypothetical protein
MCSINAPWSPLSRQEYPSRLASCQAQPCFAHPVAHPFQGCVHEALQMMFHRVGPRTEPCGTPQLILTWCAPSIVVTVLSVRYVCTISVRYSLTPRSSNALTILSHGAVLKAFSTSNVP